MVTEVRLRDGTRALAWRLLPEDRERLREAYEELPEEDKLHRFLAPVPHLTDSMLVHLVDEVDGVDHVALVLFLIGPDNVGEPVGIARMIRYPDAPTDADVAVTVLDEFQGRGVATALLDVLVHESRPVGVERIVTSVAADNPASLAMLRRIGPTTVTGEGTGTFAVTVELPEPSRPRAGSDHPHVVGPPEPAPA